MARGRTLPNNATANSAATSHHSELGTDSWWEIARTIPSIISFVIHRAATGTKEAISRKTNPRETTTGPAFQAIRRTGGTFRSAEGGSSKPLQKFSRLAMVQFTKTMCALRMPKGLSGFAKGATNGIGGSVSVS